MLNLLYSGAILGWLSIVWSAIPWISLLMLAPTLTGLRLYSINNKEDCVRVQKRLVRSSHIADGGKRLGFSIGKWYFLHIDVKSGDYGDTYTCWMIASEASFKALTGELDNEDDVVVTEDADDADDEDDAPVKTVKKLVLFDRQGSYYSVYYKRKEIRLRSLLSAVPRPDQVAIMDSIVAEYKTNGRAVAFVSGTPGSGKSMMGLFLALRLGFGYCNSLVPWQPGDTLRGLHSELEKKDRGLIVALDEVDEALVAIKTGAILPHKHTTTSVSNKTGWNRLFDDIDRGLYPNIIILMTSNQPASFVDSLDSSFLRSTRVPLKFVLGTPQPD